MGQNHSMYLSINILADQQKTDLLTEQRREVRWREVKSVEEEKRGGEEKRGEETGGAWRADVL